MFNKSKIIGSLAGLGFLLASTSNVGLAEAVRPCGATLRNLQSAKEGAPRCFIAQGTRTKIVPASAEKQTSQFQKIEQPLGLKIAVALGGLGLIGAELWWFMFSKT